jgi:hypothetical protein
MGTSKSRKSAPQSPGIGPIERKARTTLDDLFGETNLVAWRRRLDEGKVPSLAQIADIVEANKNEPLPDWFAEHLCHRLRFPDKPKRGRPSSKETYKDYFAYCSYVVELAKFQEERKSDLAAGKNRAKSDPPPNELAARYIQKTFYKHMKWRGVLNMMSSRKRVHRNEP